jgi:class 3 adenylate cyclase
MAGAERLRHPSSVPLFMDRHEFEKITAADIAAAHLKDLEVQGRYGVHFLNYWFDEVRQHAFCLASGPDLAAVQTAHRESHGMVPAQVIAVDEALVARFMGGIVNHEPGVPYVETAFRTILFTDIEGSTSLTQELGDARAMAIVRTHDEIVEAALAKHGGSEVKHTGDGVMASFVSVVAALRAAIDIQRRVMAASGEVGERLRVRIGLAAGEPVTERDDLFGAVVQLAARLCSRAEPGSVLVSSAVHDIAMGKGFAFRKRGRLTLKGFDEPVHSFEVVWQQPVSNEAAIAGESGTRIP